MEITRRLFLRNTAAAGAVVTTIGTPVAVDAAAGQLHNDNPELVRLDAEADAAILEYSAATIAMDAARIRYEEVKPAIPPELVTSARWPTMLRFCGEREMDCFGERVPHSGVMPPLIVCSYSLERQYTEAMAKRGRNWVKELHARAVAYEADVAAAKAMSGANDAWSAMYQARRRLDNLATAVSEQPAKTLNDLFVKARTYQRHADVSDTVNGAWSHSWAANRAANDIIASLLALNVRAES